MNRISLGKSSLNAKHVKLSNEETKKNMSVKNGKCGVTSSNVRELNSTFGIVITYNNKNVFWVIKLDIKSETRKKNIEIWTQQLQEVRRQEKEMLEAKARPFRQYIMAHVMPTLTAGETHL